MCENTEAATDLLGRPDRECTRSWRMRRRREQSVERKEDYVLQQGKECRLGRGLGEDGLATVTTPGRRRVERCKDEQSEGRRSEVRVLVLGTGTHRARERWPERPLRRARWRLLRLREGPWVEAVGARASVSGTAGLAARTPVSESYEPVSSVVWSGHVYRRHEDSRGGARSERSAGTKGVSFSSRSSATLVLSRAERPTMDVAAR